MINLFFAEELNIEYEKKDPHELLRRFTYCVR